MTRVLSLSVALALALTLCLGSSGLSQDNALDKLLEEIDAKAKAKDSKTPADKPEKPGSVAPKDKALDDLLEKLGQTPDLPQTKDDPRRRGGTPPPKDEDQDQDMGDDDKNKDDPKDQSNDQKQPAPKPISENDQSLDRHLEELQGKIRKPEDNDESGPSGPLGETLRKMREAEQRLAKLDTGDETQQRQREIVEELDQVLERIRQMQQGQPEGQMVRNVEMDDQQQGQEQNQGKNPGAQAGEAPEMMPQTPDSQQGIAGAKDTWGHLQGSLRDVMGNVSRMMPLRGKEDLINRYFESVAKRNVSR